jgi:hypothetical protein
MNGGGPGSDRSIARGKRLVPRRAPKSPRQDYGQRELMIRAPDGNFVVFGQAIEG